MRHRLLVCGWLTSPFIQARFPPFCLSDDWHKMSVGQDSERRCRVARKRLGEILVEAGLLSAEALKSALEQQKCWGGPLGRTLLDMQLVKEPALVQALAKQLNFPIAQLEDFKIDA